jgi:hypothetical protein
MPRFLRPTPALSLFDPASATPAWETLPEPVRREAVEILVRMIRDLTPTPSGADAGREVDDE